MWKGELSPKIRKTGGRMNSKGRRREECNFDVRNFRGLEGMRAMFLRGRCRCGTEALGWGCQFETHTQVVVPSVRLLQKVCCLQRSFPRQGPCASALSPHTPRPDLVLPSWPIIFSKDLGENDLRVKHISLSLNLSPALTNPTPTTENLQLYPVFELQYLS